MFNWINKNKKEIIIFVIIFVLAYVKYAFLKNYNNDIFWTYGWSQGIANGMIPYLDFNTVQFPFASLLYGFIMKIFGDKLMVYYIISSIISALIILLAMKINKKSIFIVSSLVLEISIGNYNLLSIFLFLILIVLEKEDKNSYLIGLILGLLVITNQKMAVLLIPAIMRRNVKENIKLIKSFTIIVELLLVYLCVYNAFNDFMNYAVLGLFDFGSGNYQGLIYYNLIELIIIFFLLVVYIKKKDIYALYCLGFQIIALPITDLYHTLFGVIIFVIYCFRINNKIFNFIIGYTCMICIFMFYHNYTNSLTSDSYIETDFNNNFYMTTMYSNFNHKIENIYDYYYENIDKYDIYFIWNDSYYAKIYMNVEINKFDFVSIGNNGYKGNEKLKNEIKSMNDVLFIVNEKKYTGDIYDQTNYEIRDFIKNNYEQIDSLGDYFFVYKIVND